MLGLLSLGMYVVPVVFLSLFYFSHGPFNWMTINPTVQQFRLTLWLTLVIKSFYVILFYDNTLAVKFASFV